LLAIVHRLEYANIFDDGSYVKSQGAIILSTEGFSLEKVKFLASVLNNKWNFKTVPSIKMVMALEHLRAKLHLTTPCGPS
jgi:hypothetical protein